jgi:VWFA-related protein
MRNWPNKALWTLAALLAATAINGVAQIVPGQLPPGPPQQPGQLGQPKTPPKETTDPPASPNEEAVPVDGNPIRTTVRYVLVPTTVLDPDGHGYVNGLNASDFEVLDNGRPQKIVAESTQQPLSVVLAVQANSDVAPLLPKIKKAGVLLQGLVTGEDGDVAVLAFDHRMQLIQDFTKDPDRLDDAMQKIKAGSSSSALIDAVLEADHMLKRRDPKNVRRRVIILLSRNVDHGSEAHLQETVRDMQFDNVIVFCIDISKALTALLKEPGYPRPANGGIPPEGMPPVIGGTGPRSQTTDVQQMNGTNALNAVPPLLRSIRDLFKKTPSEAFTNFTGGQVYSFARERGLEEAISDIGKNLNSQYLLSYSPNNKEEPGFHNIQVTVNRPGLKIRTRPGYWWGGGQTQ